MRNTKCPCYTPTATLAFHVSRLDPVHPVKLWSWYLGALAWSIAVQFDSTPLLAVLRSKISGHRRLRGHAEHGPGKVVVLRTGAPGRKSIARAAPDVLGR
ncbi:hypothetical protein MN608_08080 [Microdochium nivale]|nr:hypothetical protein MN608_08080 [Microdochium nivale]